MNDLNKVLKAFKFLEKNHNDELAVEYYKYIIRALLLEKDYLEQCRASGKVVHHHFMYWLPIRKDWSQGDMNKFFSYIYDPSHPVRFSIETFDSIEEIRLERGKRW